MACLTTYLDLDSLKIQRSGFNFKSNLTSVIGNLTNRNILASYVSHHNVMAYDRRRHNKRGREAGAPVNATQQPTKLYGRNEKRKCDERGSKAEAPGNSKQCKATQQPMKDKRQRRQLTGGGRPSGNTTINQT